MDILYVLLCVFIVDLLLLRYTTKKWQWSLAGRTAMAIMLLFTATSHFIWTEEMTVMLPPYFSYKMSIITLTGILEVGFAIGLLLPKYKRITAFLLILFLILVFPFNIYASTLTVENISNKFSGQGIDYLWFRTVKQLFFIVWVYVYALKKYKKNKYSYIDRRIKGYQKDRLQ